MGRSEKPPLRGGLLSKDPEEVRRELCRCLVEGHPGSGHGLCKGPGAGRRLVFCRNGEEAPRLEQSE